MHGIPCACRSRGDNQVTHLARAADGAARVTHAPRGAQHARAAHGGEGDGVGSDELDVDEVVGDLVRVRVRVRVGVGVR